MAVSVPPRPEQLTCAVPPVICFPNLRFSPVPAMLPVGLKREYKLLEPLRVYWDDGFFEVSEGFVHDGPSIPNRLRGLVYYTHRLLRASIAHDYLYARAGPGCPHLWSRERCDRLFLEGLAIDGVGLVRRQVMWAAVRAGGVQAWGT